MITENIDVSVSELNSTSGIVKTITDLSINNQDGFSENYLARNIIINNNTGDIVRYVGLTSNEYDSYVETSGAITNLIPLYPEQSDSLSNLRGNIKTLVVQGNGAHVSGLVISVIKTS
jgi:hypothetical protein